MLFFKQRKKKIKTWRSLGCLHFWKDTIFFFRFKWDLWFFLFPRGDEKLMLQCFWLQYVLGWSSAVTGICLFLSVFWLFEESSDIFWHFIDRLHFLHNLQNPAAPSFFCLFFCVKENYFLQLFLNNFLQDIDKYCIYSDYTVKLKTYLILILYLLLSVFVCGTDLTRNKYLRLCVYQISNELILWVI